MSIKVSRILHAGYIFENKNTKIVFDPIFENPFSRNCYAFPPIRFDIEELKKLKFDTIFISHFHDDHCSLESLNLINRATPIHIYCLHDEIPQLIRKLGFKTVHQLKLNQSIPIGNFTITPRRALDAEVDCLFQIQVEEHNILNVVDSWIDWETLDLLKNEKPWNLILWPFQTMRELEVLAPHRHGFAEPEIPEEWLEQLQSLNPKVVVPSSCQFLQEPWSWYNSAFFPISYKFFESEIKKILPLTNVVRLNPGQTVHMAQLQIDFVKSLPWIIPMGDQNVDYIYNTDLKIPLTVEIAKHFPGLNPDEKNKVDHFLLDEILQTYSSLDEIESDYFSKPRKWELRIFSADGHQKKYFYEILNGRLKIVSDDPLQPIGWLTEIAESKIFSALTDGESLTSLYVRVNDFEFTADVDATMDPLIRCLFNKNPDSYQKAQLIRLLRTN